MSARRLLPFLLASSLLASPVLAQTACAPEKLKGAVDAYAWEPFGVAAWRKLTGLGDPGLQADNYSYDSYAVAESWKTLVTQTAPDMPGLADVGYECRMGYPHQVLQQRIATFGKTSNYVKLWLHGQEAVIAACSGRSAPAAVAISPGTLKPDEENLLKDDAAYQKATQAFYADKTAAAPLLKAIGASSSPHKAAARYNYANLLANAKNLTEARAEAKAILADPALASVHDATRQLLGYISNLEDTAAGWSELIDTTVDTLNQPLSAIMANDTSKAAFERAAYDISYAGVTDKQSDWWVTNTLPADATLSKALADAARKHPMVLWMMAGQSVNKPYSKAPWTMVGDTWQAWSTSYVDRTEALQATPLPDLPKRLLDSLKAKPDDASRASLWTQALDAAMKANLSCGDAPDTGAVTGLALQALRLSAMANRYDEIYANLPKLKLEGTDSLTKVILPKLLEHILAGGNMEEGRRLRDTLLTDGFLQGFTGDNLSARETYAQFMGLVAEDQAHWLKAVSLMNEKLSPTVFNLLSAATLRKLGDEPIFSAEQQALLKRASWVRNYVLGLHNSDATTAAMFAANPELQTEWDAVKKEFPALKPDRVLLLTILRNPRFGILLNVPEGSEAIESKRDVFTALDDYEPNDKNWWCPLEPDRQLKGIRADYDAASLMSGVKDYDSKDLAALLDKDAVKRADQQRDAALRNHPIVKSVAWKEVQRLAKAPSAPEMLTKAAIGWAKASDGKDGAAEALALAVQATRYGCRWHGSVKAFSKPAQELLKAKFPTTSWAAQTPYWFDCTDLQYDADYNKVQSCKPRTWPKQAPLK